MKIFFSIFALTLLFPGFSVARQNFTLEISLVKKIDGEIRNFTTDNLGNIYLLTPSNQIKKINANGDSIAVYNNVKRYGKVYSIDATNPLKVLVFYKEFSTIVVLDRLLNARTVIDLRKQNILQVTAITSSYDNNIWLYDEFDNRLKKIDDNGNILLQSNDFRQVFDAIPLASVMYDRDGQLYMYDPTKGLLVFDYYGAKKNNYQLLHVSDLQVLDKNTITARDSAHLVLYKPATLQLITYTAFQKQDNFQKIKFNGNKIYCLTKNGQLEIYAVVGK